MQPTVRSVGCIIDPAAACLQTAVAAGMAVMICCYLLQPISYYSSLLSAASPTPAGSQLFGLQAASLTLLLPAFRLQQQRVWRL
jgi:hypothetical protein